MEARTFRLFDLPSELRVRIYEYALAPSGVLCLASTSRKRLVVEPAVTPQLLASCRHIFHEADGIIFEQNEICITLDAHDTRSPVISETRLPQKILARVQHLCVILDCTNYFNASYADVDFGPFEALVSLKSIRIAMVYRKHYMSQRLAPLHIPQLKDFNVVAQILERVPAETKAAYGVDDGSQQRETLLQLLSTRATAIGGTIVEARREDLEAAGNGVKDLVRGCKSGASRDVLARGRSIGSRMPMTI